MDQCISNCVGWNHPQLLETQKTEAEKELGFGLIEGRLGSLAREIPAPLSVVFQVCSAKVSQWL